MFLLQWFANRFTSIMWALSICAFLSSFISEKWFSIITLDFFFLFTDTTFFSRTAIQILDVHYLYFKPIIFISNQFYTFYFSFCILFFLYPVLHITIFANFDFLLLPLWFSQCNVFINLIFFFSSIVLPLNWSHEYESLLLCQFL